ncbi:MAG: M4 family metallopeptidase, partial [Cocleimonas sp.]
MLLKSSPIFYKTKVSALSLAITTFIGLSTSVSANPLNAQLVPLNDLSANSIIKNKVGGGVSPNIQDGKTLQAFKDAYKALQNNKLNSLSAPLLPVLPQNKTVNQLPRKLHLSKKFNKSHFSGNKKIIQSNVQLKLDTKGTPRFFSGFNTQASSPSYKISFTPDADTIVAKNLSFFENFQQLLKLEFPAKELKIAKLYQDKLGQFHTKYTQQYKNIPVWKSQLVTHSNQLGNVIGMTGKYIPSPSNISTTPSITVDEATITAMAKLAPNVDSNKIDVNSKLVIYSSKEHMQPLLAWELKLDLSLLNNFTALVDAKTGKLLYSFSNIHTENVAGSGEDTLGKTRQLNVWKDSGKYYLNDASKSMFDGSNTNPMDFEAKKGVINIYDARNEPKSNELSDFEYYFQISSTSANNGWVSDGVSAAYNFSKTYDYFADKHERNSLDGEGGSIKAIVRFGDNFLNAFWHSGVKMMFFGTGADFAGSLDVVAHELSHGITNSESGLTGGYQTGAINEALSDIFGEAVEQYTQGNNDWLMGTNLGVAPFRNMKDPNSINIRGLNRSFPAKMSDYVTTTQDDGGVHWNSTIPGHAFYLLAEGASYAIGMENAVNIFYRANTTHLLPRSEFSDLRLACIQSADDIHGKGSTQSKAVASAFDAVEIYDSPSTTPSKPGTPASADDSLIMVTQQSGNLHLGRYEKALGGSVYFSGTQPSGHRPAVSGDGSTAIYITLEHNICFMATESGQTSCLDKKFDDSFFSVAFSPDDRFVGIVLKDPNHEHQGLPTLNIINMVDEDADTKTYELKAARVDDSDSNKITSADAMDFTANGRYIVYDALNEFTINNKTTQVWSIYAIDLQENTTIAIVPPKPSQQVGNPSLSNIDNLITFDLYDLDKNENHIVVGNLSTGKLNSIIKTSTFSLPSFTGDDKSVVYSKVDDSTSLGFSLNIVASNGDGTPKEWIRNAYAGIVYRRGSIKAPSEVDLKVSQTVKTTPNTDDSLTFNIILKNNGPDTATNVVLNNNFSAGLEVKGNPPPGCSKKSSTTVECKVSSLKSEDTKNFSLILRVTKTGELSNSAQVNGSEEDSNPNNNTHVLKFKVTNSDGGSGGGDSK